MPTIFSKIINGEIPCHRVAENDDFLAFLDISPNSIGHTLCIPKLEIDDILDLDEETYKNLMLFSRKVAKSIKKVIKCKKVAISVIGLEVPHVHVHLIPINEMIFILLDPRNPYLDTKTIKIGQEVKILWPNHVFGVMAAFFGSRMQ